MSPRGSTIYLNTLVVSLNKLTVGILSDAPYVSPQEFIRKLKKNKAFGFFMALNKNKNLFL